ncbi:hypothetical protein LHA31_06280 [Carnobacterium viridans]|uniref:Uncharacterized protein n=1 Tax=Carnobacterium viridans TaxID=174587 RepID=A0A1H1AA66_9LACT|nr:hypothetical protein [Carnobacterium viridans]UDE94237.1 hypothetical protein LHA31_06280 [Carnobacterium viridans]SDQ36552.1 hypothetical protein SAMN04487752_1981 [Carnobacterium viridans]
MKKKIFYWILFILVGVILVFTRIDLLYEEAAVTSPFNNQVKVITVPQHPIYEYVKVSKTVQYISGYAGNQPNQGTKFSIGDGFRWSEENEAQVTTRSAQYLFGSIDPLGSIFVKVPNETDYFKLKVTEGNEVTKTAVYVKSETDDNKRFLYYLYPSSLYSLAFTPVIVH